MIGEDYIRVLTVDLSRKKVSVDQRFDLQRYLGGVGVAAKLLEEHMRPDLDPLAPEQPIVFAIGALSSIYPVVTKTVAMFVSPLTGELGESYAGGRLALTMFESGYDAIVITGRAGAPSYLTVTANDVVFRNAAALWGKESNLAGQVIRDYEKGPGGKRSIVQIGKAGENMVSYACVTVDRYRHFGRLGLGAVFGSKLLKAINIIGNRSIPIHNFREYFNVYRDIYDRSTESGGPMAKYHDAGTPINIEPLNAIGGLPTRNLQQGRFKDAARVSGDAFANKHLVRKMACTGCPVGCIHIGQYRRAFSASGYEFETVSVGYDYELIFALGTFLGLSDTQQILELIGETEEYGLDAMSTGVALGWAAEALAKKLITVKDTIVALRFGKHEGFRQAIRYISEQENQFYTHLGRGVRHVSEVYGGADFAMHIAGNEMPGYHTGYGSLVGAAVAARHSHLCNAGYALDQNLKGDVDPDSMAASLLEEEVERCLLNSLIICLFARKVYDRDTVGKALAAIGRVYSDEELTAIARSNYATKLRIKQALGFDWGQIKLPARFFETPSAYGKLEEGMAREILGRYSALLAQFTQESDQYTPEAVK